LSSGHAQVAYDLLQWSGARSGTLEVDTTTDLATFLRGRGIDSLLHLASGEPSPRQDAYDVVWNHQVTSTRHLLEELVRGGVRAVTFKGGELVARHYGDHSLGLIADLDVLVPRNQIEITKQVLYQLGFRHATFDPVDRCMRDRDCRDVADIELHHYELAPFTKVVRPDDLASVADAAAMIDRHPLHVDDQGPLIVLQVDVHHNVAADAETEGFFERAVPSTHGVAETFSHADNVWFNLTRHYNEVALHDQRSLRPFAYTLPEITCGAVDWDVVEKVAAELCLGPTLWYFLAFCSELAPGAVPPTTLDAIDATTTSRVRDWGWQLGKLFDFRETFPREGFS